jgi:DNA-binding PadR family transcriptional regulator
MYQLTEKQKKVLRAVGWTNDRIDSTFYGSAYEAWVEIGDALAELSERMTTRQIAAFEELGENEIAGALRQQLT